MNDLKTAIAEKMMARIEAVGKWEYQWYIPSIKLTPCHKGE